MSDTNPRPTGEGTEAAGALDINAPGQFAPAFRPLPSFDTTELGLTYEFWIWARNRYRYVAEEGVFLEWRPPAWHRDTDGSIHRAFQEYLGRRIRSDLQVVSERTDLSDEDQEKFVAELNRWLRWVESARGLRDGLHLFRSLRTITVHEADLDAQPYALTFQNGILDLVSGAFSEPTPKDLTTRVLPYTYDPKVRCPRFQRFLERILPDPAIREYIQRIAGRALVWNSERRKLVVFFGTGANGKTTLQKVIGRIVEPFHVTADAATLLEKKYDRIENDLARMAHARLVAVRELPAARKFDESLVKGLTGGDRITARFLHHEYFDFEVGFLLVTSTNSYPFLGDSPAMRDRIVVVPFRERIEPEEANPALEKQLEEELSGILNWALEGFRNWRVKGLEPPPVVAEFTGLIGELSMPFERIMEEIVEPMSNDSGHFLPQAWVYGAYRALTKTIGLKPMNLAWFGRRAGEHGFVVGQFGHEKVRGYCGFRLRSKWAGVVTEMLTASGEINEDGVREGVLAGVLPVRRRKGMTVGGSELL